jgi:hypothetical protein
MIFKTEQQIYNDIVAYAETALPEITDWSPGTIENAIARLCAFALSMAWKILYIVYQNIWPTTADLAGLRNWFEVFGLAWVGGREGHARRQVLALFRERALGTAAWYETTAVAQFDDITHAHFVAGMYGVNAHALIVLHESGNVLVDTKTACQAYFNAVQRKVGAIDVRVITYSDIVVLAEGVAA